MTAFNARELFEIEVSNGAPQCAPLQNGDKVIQTENDYDKDVFTGDIGIVEVENPMGACRRLRADHGAVRWVRRFGQGDAVNVVRWLWLRK